MLRFPLRRETKDPLRPGYLGEPCAIRQGYGSDRETPFVVRSFVYSFSNPCDEPIGLDTYLRLHAKEFPALSTRAEWELELDALPSRITVSNFNWMVPSDRSRRVDVQTASLALCYRLVHFGLDILEEEAAYLTQRYGCPPHPEQIVASLLTVAKRWHGGRSERISFYRRVTEHPLLATALGHALESRWGWPNNPGSGPTNPFRPISGRLALQPKGFSIIRTIIVPPVIAALLTMGGCKPKPPPSDGSHATSFAEDRSVPAGRNTDQPTAGDLTGYLRGIAPPFMRVVDVRMDPPAPAPNTSPASRRWVFNVRFTLVPTEDLLSTASQENAHAYRVVADELEYMGHWHDAYRQSSYARLYSDFNWQAPTPPPAGQTLLVVTHKRDTPLPPMYGKLAAEWQVDHWRFFPVDLDFPEADMPWSSFQVPNVILGSQAAEAFLTAARAAIIQAKTKKAAINASYTADLEKATRPGTIYKGQINHLGSVVPAEARFMASPTEDPQVVGLEVRLPATPGEVFTYSVDLAKQVPLHLATSLEPSDPASKPSDFEPLPGGDLKLSLVSADGKEGVYNETVPVRMLFVQRHYGRADVWLRLFNHRLEGGLDGDGTKPIGCVLTAQEKP